MTPLTLDRSRFAGSGESRPGRPSPIGLERVAAAPSILEAIRVTPLAVAEMEATVDSATAARSVVGHLVTAVRDDSDAVTGIAAVHALAAIPGSRADHALADVLRSGPGPLSAHAAWASAGRAPAAELLEPLVDVLIAGRLGSMHAQAALAEWARTEPRLVAAALRRGLVRTNGGNGRRDLTETLGLVPDDGVLPDLASIAADRSEREVVRVAAIAALGDRLRAAMPRSISALAGGDDRVADAVRLAESDRALRRGLLIHEPEDVAAANGRPFRLFGPFQRAWLEQPERDILAAPDAIAGVGTVHGRRVEDLLDAITPSADAALLPAPGEDRARERLARWAASRALDRYATDRDRLDLEGTSRLGQDLRWGLISRLDVWERCAGLGEGQRRFLSELAWRDFYAHLLWHEPRLGRTSFRPYLDQVAWEHDPRVIDAWRTGRTGYPVVDAAMRQLATSGWMHNRARMIAASFLTKHLGVDWRVGEQHFMEHLIDGDPASNNGGWQWAASTGTGRTTVVPNL